MSYPTTNTPSRWEQVKSWFEQRKAAGLHWLLLLTVVALFAVMFNAWFPAVVALAWHHIIPVVKWYYSVGTGNKRNLRWGLGRFGIFAITAGVFAWLWIDEGFEMAVILPVLLGISIPLWKKRDWTMLGAIWAGVVFFSEFGNGASLAAAIILSAVINYERRKFVLANLFDERVSQRPAPQPRPEGHVAPGSVYDETFFGQPGHRPAQEPRQGDLTGAWPLPERPVHDPYAQPRHGDGQHTVLPGDLPGAAQLDTTHTTAFPVPPQGEDGAPVRRGPVPPPPIMEDGERSQG